MQVIRLIKEVKLAEGRSLLPYFDHLGVPSIGYGTTYWDGRPVTMGWHKITQAKADIMLYAKLMYSIVEASKSVADFNTLCDIRQECLTEMAYQMGGAGLRRWKKSLRLINEGDWEAARVEILDSSLFRDKQTRSRAIRYSDMVYFGDEYGQDGSIDTRMERTG